jgi:hypothetical protein
MKYGTGPVKDDDDEAGNSWSQRPIAEKMYIFFGTHIYVYTVYIYIHVHARIYCAILWRYMALAKWILGGYPAVSTFDSLGLADVERLICRLST